MLPWFAASLLFLLAALDASRAIIARLPAWSEKLELAGLRRTGLLLQDAEEALQAGLVLSPETLEQVRTLDRPWGSLIYESIRDLRQAGAAVVPTLRRFRALAREQVEFSLRSRTQSAQARVQAGVCLVTVPGFSAVLWNLLPEIRGQAPTWWAVTGIAILLSCAGALWVLNLSERARWAGLPVSQRDWPLLALTCGERVLALVRAGCAPETAWNRGYEAVLAATPDLALQWPSSVWNAKGLADAAAGSGVPPPAASTHLVIDVGRLLAHAIQLSVFDGRPCLERLESGLQSFKTEFQARVEKELALLPTRTMKPLFLCVAPSVLLLVAASLFLSAGTELMEGP